jgi:hypothetical protein
MAIDSKTLLALLVTWLPFIILVLVWIYLSQRVCGNQQGKTKEFYEAQVTEMQRTNALLSRIAVALEKRAETSAQP